MHLKNVALFGVLVLVIIGCVAAAGCTTSYMTTSSDEKIVGAWTATYDDGNGMVGNTIEVFKRDGSGYILIFTDEIYPRFIANLPFTWKKNANGTYTRILPSGNTYNLSFDRWVDEIKDEKYPSAIKTRMDPITGIWSGHGTDENYEKAVFTHIIRNDGIGSSIVTYDDGSIKFYEITWKNTGDGDYALTYMGNYTTIWRINDAQNTASSSFVNSYQKQFADTYYFQAIIGPWVVKDEKYIAEFNGDGTGSIYLGAGQKPYTFTWSVPEFGMVKIHVLTGTSHDGESIDGADIIWTYDFETNSLISNETGTTWIRPEDDQDGLTFY